MSENIAFLFDNAANRATLLTASSEEVNMPVANLLMDERYSIFRSLTPVTSITIDITLNATEETAINCVGILDHNLTDIGTIQVQCWTDSIAGSNEVVNETISPWDGFYGYGGSYYGSAGYGGLPLSRIRLSHQLFSYLSLNDYFEGAINLYWRITLTDISLSYIEASRVYIGHIFQPEWNFSYGSSFTKTQNSQLKVSKKGLEFSTKIKEARLFDCVLSFLDNADRDALLVAHTLYGYTEPFFCIPRHTDDAESILFAGYYRFKSFNLTKSNPLNSRIQLALKEVL